MSSSMPHPDLCVSVVKAAYTPTKWVVTTRTKQMAQQLGPANTSVKAVSPRRPIATPTYHGEALIASICGFTNPDPENAISNSALPMGNRSAVWPKAIADAFTFESSSQGRSMSGLVLDAILGFKASDPKRSRTPVETSPSTDWPNTK